MTIAASCCVQTFYGALFVAVAVTSFGCAASSSAPPSDVQDTTTESPSPSPSPSPPPPAVPSGTVDGDLDGDKFEVHDARIFVGSLSERDASRRGVRIVLAAQPDACSQPDLARPGHRTLSFDIAAPQDPVANAIRISKGTYTVPQPLAAGPTSVFARLDARNATCSAASVMATDGAVEIEEADARHVRGSFDLLMDGERVRGRFDAPACPESNAPALETRCVP